MIISLKLSFFGEFDLRAFLRTPRLRKSVKKTKNVQIMSKGRNREASLHGYYENYLLRNSNVSPQNVYCQVYFRLNCRSLAGRLYRRRYLEVT